MADAAALSTGENSLRFPIGFIDVTTGWAGTTRVTRIDQRERNTPALRLVLDKAAQLCERPAVQCGASRLPSRYPFADVRQVFQRNPASSALSLFHNTFADHVIGSGGETPLFARQPPQEFHRCCQFHDFSLAYSFCYVNYLKG